MRMLLVPWAEKLLVCACGEEFDFTEQVEQHISAGECRENAPEGGSWVSWMMSGPGRRSFKPAMSEEKKEELRRYYEEHKEEILTRRKRKAEARKRLMTAATTGRRH